MKSFLKKLLTKPVLNLADKFSSSPDKEKVHAALSQLYTKISAGNEKKGLSLSLTHTSRFIIFSDQHKGAKDGSDDFAFAENNYLAALDFYNANGYSFISLGDNEELWENTLAKVKQYNTASFQAEKRFLERNIFYKVFGNHDLEWENSPFAAIELESIYGQKVPVYEGIILQTDISNKPVNIFLTHGHQGDNLSDGNWFSKWFVANIWAPFQSYLSINPNTPAFEDHLKTKHNLFMYEWVASQKDLLLVTGHTHQPVFKSLTNLESLYHKLAKAREANKTTEILELQEKINKVMLKGEVLPNFTGYQPFYFNSGCCCFNDGDITGIEIADGAIRLIKWEYGADKKSASTRVVLDEDRLENLFT